MDSECMPNVSADCNDNRDATVPLDVETPSDNVSVDTSAGDQSRRRVLYRVPPQLRDNKNRIYEPVVVPLGPYHHRQKPEYEVAEKLKNEVRDILCSDKGSLLGKISERINDVRHFYGGAGGYGDEELAEMMLRDACFLLFYMGPEESFDLTRRRLGMSGVLFFNRDLRMLENQIPLWLVNLLIPFIYPAQQSQSFLCDFLNDAAFWDQSGKLTQLPWKNGEEEDDDDEEEDEEPLHLLEALHRTALHLVEKQESSNILRLMNKYSQPRKKSLITEIETANSPFRSVTDLKAKGIHFRLSSPCLTDVKFFSFAFYGQLHLPFLYVTNNSLVFYSNLIAFEMSPETDTNFGITSFFYLMKTLIETAKDVKVLRESGILYSRLASDEEVVKVFKSIDTYGFHNENLFNDVKMRIDEHCRSKAKTWIAELINTKFRSPWTILALAAAAFLLCLTFLQTYYTINPRP